MTTRLVLAILLSCVLVAAVLIWIVGPRTILGFLRYDQRREGSLKVGDPAPDVVLARLDGSGEDHLAQFIGQEPLVLVFGSFT